ncbi:HAMP domain-containing sensor histidine kinase [Microlunatus aurantiacus]|uniref:sensor histidine kinase n=1 Tax=Microlunatus aurantiacus TaxID=446786 RepID=UPI0031D3F2BF
MTADRTRDRAGRPTRSSRRPVPWRPLSVRARILTAVLVTTALGMLGAGGVSYLIAREQTLDNIRNSLLQENEEINTVATLAGRGETGRTITGPGDVLWLAIKSSVPDPDEAIIGLVNGQVEWVPSSEEPSQKSLENDPELIAAAAAVRPGAPVQLQRLSTAGHPDIAFMSVPVQVKGSPDLGHYVAAVDVRLAFQPIIRTHLTYAGVALVALVAIGIVGYQVAGKLLSPLRSLRSTAQRITETDLSDRIPVDELAGDEVGDLGRTMNSMLDRLSASFDNQRRLLDDAGHELKTPITIVRGHLELVDPNDPADVIETRDLAIEELDRMRRLVDEILMLAKARRPDFVQPEPVVVADLLAGVLDKVIALGDRRWLIESTSNEVVQLDPQRITQALIQLVANALKFTEPGSVVALGGRIYGPEVRLWVRDEGIGIHAEDRSRIFERFGRGSDPIGTQPPGTDDGAGLGLAIVDAIAQAHHGRVALSSEVGVGSAFTLCLPRTGRSIDHDEPVAGSDPPPGSTRPAAAADATTPDDATTRETVTWPPS